MRARTRWICLAVIVGAFAWAQPAAAATQPTITSSPTSPGTARALTFQFTGDPLDSFECQLDGPGGTVEAFTGCSSPKDYTLDPAAPDGVYTFSVHAIDLLLGQSVEIDGIGVLENTVVEEPEGYVVPEVEDSVARVGETL